MHEGRAAHRHTSTAIRVELLHSEGGEKGSASGVPVETKMTAQGRSGIDQRGRRLVSAVVGGRMRIRIGSVSGGAIEDGQRECAVYAKE